MIEAWLAEYPEVESIAAEEPSIDEMSNYIEAYSVRWSEGNEMTRPKALNIIFEPVLCNIQVLADA